MKTLPKFALVLAAVASLAGCVSVPDNAGQDPSDPWETMNRNTFAFNQKLDTYVYRPVAKGYEFVVPEYARERIGNIYVNLNEPANAINNALQGKGEGALVSLFRLMINTTLGLGGMYDVAGTAANQPTRREDFGQTLAVWGVGNGPYFVIPFLGGLGCVCDGLSPAHDARHRSSRGRGRSLSDGSRSLSGDSPQRGLRRQSSAGIPRR